MRKLDVVIVSRGRHELLLATLSCLMASQGVALHVHHGFIDDQDWYSYQQLRKVPSAVKQWSVTEFPAGTSVAKARATLLSPLTGRCLMIDGDVWFHPLAIQHYMTAADDLTAVVGAMGIPMVDVDGGKGWPNHSLEVVNDAWSDPHRSGKSSFFHRTYLSSFGVDHISTLGLWDVHALRQSGVLDMWLEWPDGRRGYDTIGSARLAATGHPLVLAQSETAKGDMAAYHLYTKVDEVENVWTDTAWACDARV